MASAGAGFDWVETGVLAEYGMSGRFHPYRPKYWINQRLRRKYIHTPTRLLLVRLGCVLRLIHNTNTQEYSTATALAPLPNPLLTWPSTISSASSAK